MSRKHAIGVDPLVWDMALGGAYLLNKHKKVYAFFTHRIFTTLFITAYPSETYKIQHIKIHYLTYFNNLLIYVL